VSRLNGELVEISISHEDLRQSLEEQEATVLNMQRQAEEAHQSLEGENKQVEGEFAFARFSLVDLFFLGFAPNFVSLCSWLSGLRNTLVGVEDEVAMNRADGLVAPAADALAEDFMEFLFPDAPGADNPQA
jgi:hypothetical protein